MFLLDWYPTKRFYPVFLIAVCLSGCGPKKAERDDSMLGPQPTATPSTEPFRILLEVPEANEASFKGTLERDVDLPGGWRLEWERFETFTGEWDLAFVSPIVLKKLSADALDLGDLLDRIFPLHKADFIVSASDFREEGKLSGVPALLMPHFLYVKDASLATSSGLKSYLAAGNRIALPAGGAGEWYRSHLNVDSKQVVSNGSAEEDNPFLAGAVAVAIADRSWIATRRIPPDQIHSLSGLELSSKIPDWGTRLAISNRCVNPSLAQTILKSVVVDLQEKLVGAGGGVFPIRRSVYQSPRIQGAFLGAPKSVFDSTLESLGTPQ